jgi:HEAT repeat protein
MSDRTPGIGAARKPDVPSDIERLLIELRDFDDDVRIDATKALSTIRDPQVTTALQGRLKDRSARVRWQAIDALVKTGNQSACASIQALLNDCEESVRAEAAWALGELQCQESAMALVEAVDDYSPDVAQNAGISLGKLRDTSAMQELISQLSKYRSSSYYDGYRYYGKMISEHLLNARVFALAQMGMIVVTPLLKSIERAHNRVYEVDQDGCSPVSQYVERAFSDRVQVLLALDRSQIIEFFSKWYSAGKPWGGRILAVQCLAQTSDPAAASLLCRVATSGETPPLRWFAVEGLEKVPPTKESIRALIAVLRNDELASLRSRAAAALEKHPLTEKSSQAFIAMLHGDKEISLRRRAAEALGNLKATDAVPALCKVVTSTSDPEVAQQAMLSLGEIGDSRAIPTLTEVILNDYRDRAERRRAAKALGGIHSRECMRPLLSALGSDGDPVVRKTAAEALGQLGFKDAIEPLKIVADGRDEDEQVIEAAKAALAAMRRQ